MSDHGAAPAAGHHHGVEREIIEERDGRPSWWVRMLLAIGGIVLLAAAIAAWQFQGSFGGHLQMLLPWLVVGAILLGGAAIIESVTAEIWVTLIGGIFVLLAAYVLAGRVTVQIDAAAHQAYVVDRFTGQVRICNSSECRELPGFGTVSGVSPKEAAAAKSTVENAAVHVEMKIDALKPAAKPKK